MKLIKFIIIFFFTYYFFSCSTTKKINYSFNNEVNVKISDYLQKEVNKKKKAYILLMGESYGAVLYIITYEHSAGDVMENIKRTNRFLCLNGLTIPIVFYYDIFSKSKPRMSFGGYAIKIDFQGNILGAGDSF